MSGFSGIDLSKLPAPEVIETVAYETLLGEMKAEAVNHFPELETYLALESEPTTQLLRVCAYFRMLDRLEFNDGAKSLLLAYATGGNLDHLAALFSVARPVIQKSDESVSPPIEELKLGDVEFRQLVQLSPEGRSTAGPRGSYLFHALAASGSIKDVSVTAPEFERLDLDPSLAAQLPANAIVLQVVDAAGLADPMPGDVAVSVLGRDGNGEPSEADLIAVQTGLDDEDTRPLTDHPRCLAATIIEYEVTAVLTLYEGPDAGAVLSAANSALGEYIEMHHRLGHDISLSGLYAALHQPGVQNVQITAPIVDIVVGPAEAAFCIDTSITIGGRDV